MVCFRTSERDLLSACQNGILNDQSNSKHDLLMPSIPTPLDLSPCEMQFLSIKPDGKTIFVFQALSTHIHDEEGAGVIQRV